MVLRAAVFLEGLLVGPRLKPHPGLLNQKSVPHLVPNPSYLPLLRVPAWAEWFVLLPEYFLIHSAFLCIHPNPSSHHYLDLTWKFPQGSIYFCALPMCHATWRDLKLLIDLGLGEGVGFMRFYVVHTNSSTFPSLKPYRAASMLSRNIWEIFFGAHESLWDGLCHASHNVTQ